MLTSRRNGGRRPCRGRGGGSGRWSAPRSRRSSAGWWSCRSPRAQQREELALGDAEVDLLDGPTSWPPAVNSFSTPTSSIAARPSSSGTAGRAPPGPSCLPSPRPLSQAADPPIRPHGHDGTLAPRPRSSMYEPALATACCHFGTVGITSPTPAAEDVGGLEGEPELDPVAGPVEVTAGQLGDPADTVAKVCGARPAPWPPPPSCRCAPGTPAGWPPGRRAGGGRSRPGAEQAAGDGLQGGVLLPGQQQAVAAQVADGRDPGRRRPAGRPPPGRTGPPGRRGAGRAGRPRACRARSGRPAPGQDRLGHRLGGRAGLGRVGRLEQGDHRGVLDAADVRRRPARQPVLDQQPQRLHRRLGPVAVARLATSTAIAGEAPRPRKRRRRRISSPTAPPPAGRRGSRRPAGARSWPPPGPWPAPGRRRWPGGGPPPGGTARGGCRGAAPGTRPGRPRPGRAAGCGCRPRPRG